MTGQCAGVWLRGRWQQVPPGDGWGLCCRCAGSPEAGPLVPEHAALLTSFAKAVVRRMQALKFVQLDPVSLFLPSAL